ncbi:carboxymuconolactone decarboxylase family protein [Aquitalea sp. ASV15]|uniref:carboxymuconolactone decarboxylase family protein n=1 Tax=Aquitalea sp. ASV15 TaxID=2795104 RepID=UPI0018EAA250|nr:carboxymuconolactone decarboxylase family protein [Aquitalea sp. ASV15]
MTSLRQPYAELSGPALQHLRAIKKLLEDSPLGRNLVELVYLRVSQRNGCAFCLDMHARALRSGGESPVRLDTLAGWHLSPHFTAREKAALAWAESLTDIASSQADDAAYQPLLTHFSAQEICDLTMAIASMNALNRLAIAMRQ